jgi:hypothetical protein
MVVRWADNLLAYLLNAHCGGCTMGPRSCKKQAVEREREMAKKSLCDFDLFAFGLPRLSHQIMVPRAGERTSKEAKVAWL